jgi:hypothetical protein
MEGFEQGSGLTTPTLEDKQEVSVPGACHMEHPISKLLVGEDEEKIWMISS